MRSGLAVPARQVVRESEAVSPPVVLKRGPSPVWPILRAAWTRW